MTFFEVLFDSMLWSEIWGVKILDPDGWRNDSKSFTDRITFMEFMDRARVSTVMIENHEAWYQATDIYQAEKKKA